MNKRLQAVCTLLECFCLAGLIFMFAVEDDLGYSCLALAALCFYIAARLDYERREHH
jgi:hypothetical protein